MKMYSSRFFVRLAGMVLLATGAMTAAAESIRLKAAASVAPKQDVRLGDIATVTGENPARVQELADTVLIADVERSIKVDSNTVLMAVISQRGVGAGGTLHISGAAECVIDVNTRVLPVPDAMAATEQVSMTVKTNASPVAVEPVAMSKPATAEGQTLAAMIRERIVKELKLSADDVTVRFETVSPLLEHVAPSGRKWLCRPLTKTFLGTVQFEAQLVEGTKIVEKLNVQTNVQRLQWVVVAVERIKRGDVVQPQSLRLERQPVDRRMTTLFASDKDVAGLEAQKDIEIGALVDTRDFRPAYLVRKNEPVTVILVGGNFSLQTRGRALGDARLHESVKVRDDATREVYNATVISKNIATMGGSLTAEQELKILEGM